MIWKFWDFFPSLQSHLSVCSLVQAKWLLLCWTQKITNASKICQTNTLHEGWDCSSTFEPSDDNMKVNHHPEIQLLSLLSLSKQREGWMRRKMRFFFMLPFSKSIYFPQSWSGYHNLPSVFSFSPSILLTLGVKKDWMWKRSRGKLRRENTPGEACTPAQMLDSETDRKRGYANGGKRLD